MVVATPAIREPVDSSSGSIAAAGAESPGSGGVRTSSLLTKRAYVVTPKLSHASSTLRRVISIRFLEEPFEMNDINCPWCEADLALHVVSDEQTCSQCGTRWSYEDEPADELPIAA